MSKDDILHYIYFHHTHTLVSIRKSAHLTVHTVYNLPTLLYSVPFLNFVTFYLNVIKIITVVIMLKKETKTVKLSKKQL